MCSFLLSLGKQPTDQTLSHKYSLNSLKSLKRFPCKTKQIYFKPIKTRTTILFSTKILPFMPENCQGSYLFWWKQCWGYSPDWTWCLCSDKTLTHCFLNTVHINYMYHYKPFTGRSILSPLVTQFVTFQNVWRNNLIFQYNYKVCSYPTENWFL